MVHISKSSPPKFLGKASVWAERLGSWAVAEWVKSKSLAKIVAHHPVTRKPCLIVPSIEHGGRGVMLTVFYGVLPRALASEHLTADHLTSDNWRERCRAWVTVVYDPDFSVIDHDGSIRASLALFAVWSPRAPSPPEIDKAFSTRLQERADRDTARVKRIVHGL